MVLAMLNLHCHMDKFLVLAKQLSISVRRFWLVRHDADDRCKLALAEPAKCEGL